jgi:hypothetical protein
MTLIKAPNIKIITTANKSNDSDSDYFLDTQVVADYLRDHPEVHD